MAGVPALPVADGELAGLFSRLQSLKPDCVMLAVSGGTDSLALLHLFARFVSLTGWPARTLVATVDHRLRAESATEAAYVARESRRLGLPHETLVWHGEKPASGRQQAARTARYQLIAQRLCLEPGPARLVVTAHTSDDQAETFLMRLARGSGLDGLSVIKPARELEYGSGIVLIRPLLGVSRARLTATLASLGVTPVEDPGNTDSAYERVRARATLKELAKLDLTGDAIARSAYRLERARSALEAVTVDLEARSARIFPGVATTFDGPRFWHAPAELRVRLLARALQRHGGAGPPARLLEIEAALDRLGAAEPNGAGTMTLGGCVIAAGAEALHVFREVGRAGLGEVMLEPGTSAPWDSRFVAALSEKAEAPAIVRAIPPDVSGHTKVLLTAARLPARIGHTLPSFWRGGVLIGLPPLDRLLVPGAVRHTDCIPPTDGEDCAQDGVSAARAAACSLSPLHPNSARDTRIDELQ